jgi:hypothetical protein
MTQQQEFLEEARKIYKEELQEENSSLLEFEGFFDELDPEFQGESLIS